MNDELCSGSLEISNAANEYLAKVGENLGSNFLDSVNFLTYLGTIAERGFTFDQISLEYFETVVHSLKNSSPGHGELPIWNFKNKLDLLGGTLLLICNKSLSQCIFPDEMRIAKMTPIFEKMVRKYW